jgi:oxygen-independent coproporphyrinogen III oxidase
MTIVTRLTDCNHVLKEWWGLFLRKCQLMIDARLLEKYNVPVLRYTSYPTVPYWKENIDVSEWEQIFKSDCKTNNQEKGISLYIHLPFCESLCTYCGCNKKITTNHSVETEYIEAILLEWQLYARLMDEKPVIGELHLGGGTPTFFSPANLERLLSQILNSTILHPEHDFSFEGHPNNTTKEHLEQFYQLGFRRVSFGVQDNDPEVQRIINRMQPFENVKYVTETARSIGYKSVNFDLIYGLPLQSEESISRTIKQTISLRPDRVAFYSYAHVPWTSRGQRLFDEHDLPTVAEKVRLYQTGKNLFLQNGYSDIGMDHFALPSDDLYKVSQAGALHRNFMGYTTQNTDILVGLGVSSISSTGSAFVQNAKTIHNYYNNINNQKLAIEKGCFLNKEDTRFGKYILDISCRGWTKFLPGDMEVISNYCLPELEKLQTDNLIMLKGGELIVTELGKNFIRNICSAFDLYLLRNKMNKEKRLFSNAI